MSNYKLDGFDVVVIEQIGEISKTTCFRKAGDYFSSAHSEILEESSLLSDDSETFYFKEEDV